MLFLLAFMWYRQKMLWEPLEMKTKSLSAKCENEHCVNAVGFQQDRFMSKMDLKDAIELWSAIL